MKITQWFVISMVALTLIGCSSSRDITNKVGARTDYVTGQTYQLKKPVFLFMYDKDSGEIPRLYKLGASGFPSTLDEFRRKALFHRCTSLFVRTHFIFL